MKAYMVFDIGGTYIKYAVMNENGTKLEGGKVPTPQEGLEEFLQKISEIVTLYRQSYAFQGIALSSPGAVDVKSGYIGGASAIPYIHNVPITELIRERTDLDVSIENDANCAALAEGWLGAAKETDYYICVVIGTGIGGSIVMNHTILRGASLHGGEFGYMIMGDPLNNPLESTWSQVASTNALVQEVERRKSLEKGSLDGEKVFLLAAEGDAVADDCIKIFYKKLASGIYNIKYALDPGKILIGGGISKRPEVIEGINQELKQLKDEIATLDITVEACHFDNDANLIGALFHNLNRK
ncbi:ROK family protein [Bacillus sp. EB106-08-02-XG196]|jgi:predicted NBD/HSP70 family sugar kinase|uniref:ROK family protein n=1 Tax=Bacillus sp. EB106-08-02-XG196 TaxID=2737049 RepID=UPI0015C44685|nr:ROK family protein [Bacillus sp. EB106-08-02-XG196]NWQ39628.1 ROK family protein [Bacillus sp. EB106-08-02-XG196]